MTRSAPRPRPDASAALTGDDPGSLTIARDGPCVCECALAATPDAAGAARAFTRNTLRQWDRDDLIDDATLIVSELVTNAVLHGMPGDLEDNDAGDGEEPILLQLVSQTTSVLCIVHDPSSTPPRVMGGDVLTETHRGLCIVAELSTAWGWTPHGQRGKSVWAVLDAAHQPAIAQPMSPTDVTVIRAP
jgi:anti-sigma regulatory factor (Ser/Thr protein kinase)